MNNARIAFIGDCTVDKYPDIGEVRYGGSSLNGAVWAIREKTTPLIIGAVGTDTDGDSYIRFCQSHDFDVSHIARMPGQTSSITIFTDSNGERQYGAWEPGVLVRWIPTDEDVKRMRTSDAMVLVVYDKTVHILHSLTDRIRAGEIGPPTSSPLRIVDFGDLSQFNKSPAVVSEVADSWDVLFFGLDAQADRDLIDDLSLLPQRFPVTVVITLASAGSIAISANDRFEQPAIAVDSVVDTTGAGDSFIAGYVTEYLRTKHHLSALKNGARIAAEAIRILGAY